MYDPSNSANNSMIPQSLSPEQAAGRRRIVDATMLGGAAPVAQNPTHPAQMFGNALAIASNDFDAQVRKARAAGQPDPQNPFQRATGYFGFDGRPQPQAGGDPTAANPGMGPASPLGGLAMMGMSGPQQSPSMMPIDPTAWPAVGGYWS